MDERAYKIKKMKSFIKRLFRRRIVIAGAAIVFFFVFVAVFAPFLAPYDPYQINPAQSMAQPSAEHLLGTDNIGRDVLSRIIYGTRTSLLIGIVAVMISAVCGIVLGMLSGYIGGNVDILISRCMEALMAIPNTMLALTLGLVLGGGLKNLMIILGISTIPTYTRMMRGQVMSIRSADYIMAAEVVGVKRVKIMFSHVLPNCLSPLIVLLTRNIGTTILAESSLSFLGLGINPPMASWGGMVNDGYTRLIANPAFGLAPGLCVLLLVMGFNIFGDGLRDVLDPRLRGTI